MKNLLDFINKHCQQVPLGEGDLDIEFFGVKIIENPSNGSLKELVQANKQGEFGTDFDLFDGKEHNFINLGGWIGDQGYALRLMALGYHLELWELLTPNKLMPFLDDEMKSKMAGMGMISIICHAKE